MLEVSFPHILSLRTSLPLPHGQPTELFSLTLSILLLSFCPGLSVNPRPEPLARHAFSTPVLCHQTPWERIPQSQYGCLHTSVVPTGSTFGACPSAFWISFSDYWEKKKRQPSSQSLSTKFSADSPTETKVIRHLSARSWCCYFLDIKAKTKPLHYHVQTQPEYYHCSSTKMTKHPPLLARMNGACSLTNYIKFKLQKNLNISNHRIAPAL